MLGRGSIFIVEDDPQLLGTLIQAFEQRGYFVWGCPWTNRARTIFAQVHPDFILLDVNVGDYERIELVVDLKTQSPDTRVIVECTMADMDVMDRIMASGADAFVIKPFLIQPLFKMMEQTLAA
jgi:DNA-binding response OmpR family regulator